MPKGYPPTIFVSSTCYDLNQVRADLKRFFENLGLDPILSESPAFPVNPGLTPVQNCLGAVKERADIFVLIIGQRYGYQTDSGKSITNLEYIEAKAKGIPIYIFVKKQIIHLLPMWRQNLQADYSNVVDTPKLFAFVDELRNATDHWVFEFDEAQHIQHILRNQLAFLFMEGLVLRERFKSLSLPSALLQLTSKCLKLILEKTPGWEILLFASALSEAMQRERALKLDLKYSITIENIRSFDNPLEVVVWLRNKMRDVQALVNSASTILNKAIEEAMGPKGQHGNPEDIVYCAETIAKVRKQLIMWSLEFGGAQVPERLTRLLSLMAQMSSNAIEQIERIPTVIEAEMAKASEALARGEQPVINLMFEITIPIINEITREFEVLSTLSSDQY